MNAILRKAIHGRDIVLIGGPYNLTYFDEIHTDAIVFTEGKYEATGDIAEGREKFLFKENEK